MASLPDEQLDDADTSRPGGKRSSAADGDAPAGSERRSEGRAEDHEGEGAAAEDAAIRDGADAGGASGASGVPEQAAASHTAAGAEEEFAAEPEPSDGWGELTDKPEPRQGLTPREARRVRAITAAVCMVCIAVGLLVQLSGEASLMTLALYGVAMVLSGVAIKLSYAGRTRVAMAVVVLGFGLVVAEQVLRWI